MSFSLSNHFLYFTESVENLSIFCRNATMQFVFKKQKKKLIQLPVNAFFSKLRAWSLI